MKPLAWVKGGAASGTQASQLQIACCNHPTSEVLKLSQLPRSAPAGRWHRLWDLLKTTPGGDKNSHQSFGLVHFFVFMRWFTKYRFTSNDKIQWSNCSLPMIARIWREVQDFSEHILFFLKLLLLVFVRAVIQQGYCFDPFKTVLTILYRSVSLSPCISRFLCLSRLQYLIV